MIEIANLLLTRKCNLKCSYCNLVKDYQDKPNIYPDMSYYHNLYFTGEQWCDIIQRLVAHNNNVFVILYGGEPFLYRDLDKVLDYCNKQKVNYTIISNTTGKFVQDRIIQLFNKCGKYRGFTASVDPIALMPDDKIPSIYKDMVRKSRQGISNLINIKKSGLSDDVVAEITILKDALQNEYVYDIVKKLSDNGIVSSITAVDARKTPFYDFSSIEIGDGCLLEKTPELRQLFDKLIYDSQKGLLKIHIPRILDELYNILPSNYRCGIDKHIHNVSIEPDGTFRLCLRIRGSHSPSLPYQKVISTTGVISDEFVKAIQTDYGSYCKCCNWTCPQMSSLEPAKILNH
jgi:MoaA/NifB/PqqE/SkfB family radical SAM enzyme